MPRTGISSSASRSAPAAAGMEHATSTDGSRVCREDHADICACRCSDFISYPCTVARDPTCSLASTRDRQDLWLKDAEGLILEFGWQ